MKPRVKRLYRVTARFVDGYVDGDGVTRGGYVRTWHYQDKRAAEHRAQVCRDGLPEQSGFGPNGDDGYLPACPRAEWVHVEESHPVTWPDVTSAP